MRTTRLRTLLWLTAALGAAGTAAAFLWAAWPPGAAPPAARALPAPAPPPPPGDALPPLEAFEPAWRVPLRRPLSDPPPAAAAATTEPERPAELMVRLIGTIVAGDHPRGVFLVGLAAVEVKGVGDRAGGAEILRIGENDATVSWNGATFVLKREKHPFDPNGGGPEPAAARSDEGKP